MLCDQYEDNAIYIYIIDKQKLKIKLEMLANDSESASFKIQSDFDRLK